MLRIYMAASEECSWLQNLDWEQARHTWRATVEAVISLARSRASGGRDQQMVAGRCLFQVLLPGALSEQLSEMDELLDEVVAMFDTLKLQVMTTLSSPSYCLEEAKSELEVINGHISSLVKCREKITTLMYPPYLVMVLKVVHCLLTLCHEVERQKEWALHHLTVNLSDLFRTTYSLLKHSLEDIVAVPVTDVSFILLTRLVAVADVSLTFDPSLPVLCWKSIGKVLCKSKPHLLSHDWSVQPIVSQLCVAIETKCKECVGNSSLSVDETTRSDVHKLLKLCRFLSTLLLRVVQEFEAVSHEFADHLAHLLISLHTSVKDGSHTSSICNDIEENILVLRDPLVSAMSSCEAFVKKLLVPPDGGHYLAWLECLSTLIKVFPQIPDGLQEYLMSSISSREDDVSGCRLLDAVFLCLMKCHTELSLPIKGKGLMYNGNPLRWVTLYELIATHLCALVQCASVNYFQTIELCLMKQLLSSHPYCSLMAMDVWTLMSRLAGDNVTENHIEVLSKLVNALPDGIQQLAVAGLLQRLMTLLSEEPQRRFVAAYPPTVDHLSLWAHINLKNLHGDVASQVCLKLAESAMTALKGEKRKAASNPAYVVTILRCLCNIYKYDLNHFLPHRELAELIPSLLTSDLRVICHALKLVSLMVSLLPSTCLEQVFHEVSQLVDASGASPEKAIALSSFLSECCTGSFHVDVQDGALKTVIKCYQVLLSNPHWIACHTALESFKAFAEVTPYPTAVERCIPSSYCEMVVGFLHKVPHCSDTINESMVKRYLGQQANELQDWPRLTNQDGLSVNNCLAELSELRQCWNKVKALLAHPSQTQLEELEDLCSDMDSYLHNTVYHEIPA